MEIPTYSEFGQDEGGESSKTLSDQIKDYFLLLDEQALQKARMARAKKAALDALVAQGVSQKALTHVYSIGISSSEDAAVFDISFAAARKASNHAIDAELISRATDGDIAEMLSNAADIR